MKSRASRRFNASASLAGFSKGDAYMAATRKLRRAETGVVVSAKANKTRRVEVERLVKHKRYNKYIRQRLVCHAHDETNSSHLGDLVAIQETRPLSKLKRWRVVQVLSSQDEAGHTETTQEPVV